MLLTEFLQEKGAPEGEWTIDASGVILKAESHLPSLR